MYKMIHGHVQDATWVHMGFELFPTELFPTELFPTEPFPTELFPTELFPTLFPGKNCWMAMSDQGRDGRLSEWLTEVHYNQGLMCMAPTGATPQSMIEPW